MAVKKTELYSFIVVIMDFASKEESYVFLFLQ